MDFIDGPAMTFFSRKLCLKITILTCYREGSRKLSQLRTSPVFFNGNRGDKNKGAIVCCLDGGMLEEFCIFYFPLLLQKYMAVDCATMLITFHIRSSNDT